jgi:hypothetical protein
MSTQIQIVIPEEIDKTFSTQIQRWTNEVLEKAEFPAVSPHLCIIIWKTMEKFHAFYSNEKEELGVVTGEESDFLATHDAWRGYPRIHICQERVMGIPNAVVQSRGQFIMSSVTLFTMVARISTLSVSQKIFNRQHMPRA